MTLLIFTFMIQIFLQDKLILNKTEGFQTLDLPLVWWDSYYFFALYTKLDLQSAGSSPYQTYLCACDAIIIPFKVWVWETVPSNFLLTFNTSLMLHKVLGFTSLTPYGSWLDLAVHLTYRSQRAQASHSEGGCQKLDD